MPEEILMSGLSERNLICFEKKRRADEVIWRVLKNEIHEVLLRPSIFLSALSIAWR